MQKSAFSLAFWAFSCLFASKSSAQDSCLVTGLWPNGDFEQTQSLIASGWYLPCIAVIYDPIDDEPGGNTAADIDDHTPTGNGNFLWVDHTQALCSGFFNLGDNIPILRRNIQTQAGEVYNFSFWVYRYCNGATGEFGVWVNGQKMNAWSLTDQPCTVGWQFYEANFTATGPSTQITLMDVNWQSAGWDYAIDDIELKTIFAPAPFAGLDTTICAGGCAILTGQGGQPDIVATWSPADFTSLAAGDTVVRVCPLVTTTYSMTVTNSKGCSDVDEVRVFVAKSPEITVDSAVCRPDLTAFDLFFRTSVPASVWWNGPPGPLFDSLGPQLFRLRGVPRDSAVDLFSRLAYAPFCTDSLRAEPPNCDCPTVSPPQPMGPTKLEFCQNEAFSLLKVAAPTADFAVDWFDESTGGNLLLANSTTFLPAAPGSFFAEKRLVASGCRSSRLEFLVEKRPDPEFEITGDTAACGFSPVVLMAKPAPNSASGSLDSTLVFEWPDGSTGPDFSVAAASLAPFSVAVVATDTAGCAARDSVFLTVKKPPFFAATSFECTADRKSCRIFFEFDPAQTHVADPDTLVLTQNGPTTGFIDARPGQVFWVNSQSDATAFSSLFCFASAQLLAPDCGCPVIESPVATSPSALEICAGQPFPTFSVASKSGVSVAWFDSPTAANPLIINELAFQPTGAGTFFAEARDTLGDCQSARTAFSLAINPLPILAISGDSTACAGEQISLTASSQPPGSIVWGSQPPSPILNVTPTQSTSYVVKTTTPKGCSSSRSVAVAVFPRPLKPVSLGDSSFCKGAAPKSLAVTVGQGLLADWFSTPAGANPLIINELRFLPSAAGTFWAEAVDTATGCRSATRTAVRLFENPSPEAEAGPAKTIGCGDSTAVLSGFAAAGGQPFSIFWTTADGKIEAGAASPEPTVSASGTYNLLIINDLSGCKKTDSTRVERLPMLAAAFLAEQPTCAEPFGKIIFSASGGSGGPFEFSIDGGQTFRADSIFEGLLPGLFDLKVIDAAGCERALEAELFSPQNWQISLPATVDLALGDSVLLSLEVDPPGVVFSKIDWSPAAFLSCDSCLSTIVTPSASMRYVVFAADAAGCRDSAQTTVLVDPAVDFYAPTALRAGGDRFTIFAGGGLVEISFLRIFDRWGGLVFDEKSLAPGDSTAGWDGTVGGQKVAPGAYAWVAELVFLDGKRRVVGGSVGVVR